MRSLIDLGVGGIVVSNHGGRRLDGVSAAIEVLPEVAAAVGGKLEVYLDGGIRRGSDVVKALALGATAVLIGRPYIYGLAVRGQRGIEDVLDILRRETDNTMALLGCPSIADIDSSLVKRVDDTTTTRAATYPRTGFHAPAGISRVASSSAAVIIQGVCRHFFVIGERVRPGASTGSPSPGRSRQPTRQPRRISPRTSDIRHRFLFNHDHSWRTSGKPLARPPEQRTIPR